MNMVEKVAKSLYPNFDKECVCNKCNQVRRNARAAIAAMREPSEGMIREGSMIQADYDPGDDDFLRCWQAAIDAALKE